MQAESFGYGSEALVAALLLAVLGVATLIGYALARGRKAGEGGEGSEVATTQSATLEASVLGLLALLLGFAFSAALGRYEARTQLVVAEANAIGTVALRAQLLAEPQRSNVAGLLREYVAARLAFHRGGGAPAAQGGRTGAALQDALWAEARAAAAGDPHSVVHGLFISALNDMIDLSSTQLAELRNVVPGALFGVLLLVAAIAVGFSAYGAGVAERRNLRATLLVALLVSCVVLLIVDLDRPTSGLVHVSLQSLVDLQASLPAR